MKTQGLRKSKNVRDKRRGDQLTGIVGQARANADRAEWDRKWRSEPTKMGKTYVSGMRKKKK